MTERPTRFDTYQGNEQAKKILKEAIQASKIQAICLPHILIYGPAGTGKTTLANIVANESGYKLITTVGSAIRFQVDILKLLHDIAFNSMAGCKTILFIDEIHNLDKQGLPETLWYPILEDFIFYSNLEGKSITYNGAIYDIFGNRHVSQPFCCIGATTDPGMLTAPLRRRFKIQVYMEGYRLSDIEQIIRGYGRKQNFFVTTMAAQYIAKRSRDNPATAISLTEACIRRVIVEQNDAIEGGRVHLRIARETLRDMGVMDYGLKVDDIKVLEVLAKVPKGMGQSNIAKSCGISVNHYAELIEPFLKAQGWIQTTHKTMITSEGLVLLKKLSYREGGA